LSLLSKAIEYHNRAFLLRLKIGDSLGIAGSLNSIGNLFFYQYEYQNSIDKYFKAANLYRQINHRVFLAMTYNNIAVIYQNWNKPKKALEYYKLAEDIYRETTNLKSLSMVLLNMAETYNSLLNDNDAALKLNNESLKIKFRIGNKIGIALIYNNLGNLNADNEKYSISEKHFEESKKIYGELKSIGGLSMVEHNIGKLLQKKMKYLSAITQFKSSLELAEEIGYVDYISSNQEALFECYVALGDYENFEKYYHLYKTSQDTLIEKLNTAEMLEIEAKYRAKEADGKLNQLQVEFNKNAHKLYLYRLLFYSLLGLTILSIIFFIAYFYAKKKRD